ncbi:MAG: MarR family transcriptional regulator [Clostridiaceae bacterium]
MEGINEDSLYAIFNQVIKLKFARAHRLLDSLGLHPGQAHLLQAVGHNKGISQNQLAKILNVKPATVTGMIKKMEKASLIERKVDEDDQRILRVYPTEAGEKLGLKLKGYYDEIGENCFKNFTNEELILFRRFLMQMKSNLEDINEEKLDKEFPEF